MTDWNSIANFTSIFVAGFVAYSGLQAAHTATGKAKTAIRMMTMGVLVLGGLEVLALFGWSPPAGSFWQPLFWDLDILTSIFVLMAIRALRKN